MSAQAGEQSQAIEQAASVSLKQFVWAAIKLNLVASGFLVVQWLLLGINTSAITFPEVLALSFLMSWQFVRRAPGALSLWHGAVLGVMASVLRTGFIFFFMPGGIALFGTLAFILPNTLILLGCIAGAFLASRR